MNTTTEYHYFYYEWIVRPLSEDQARKLQKVVAKLKIDPHNGFMKQDTQGAWIIPLAMRVKALETFNDFIREIGSEIGWTDWIPIAEKNWIIGPALGLNPYSYFLKCIHTFGLKNQKIDVEQSNKS